MRISTLISSHNKGATLERCIRSAAEQSHPPCEIRICEDASTDDSVAIVQRLQQEFPTLALIQYPQKAADWIAEYMRQSADCVGDYLHLLAADDYLIGGFYEAARDVQPQPGVILAQQCNVRDGRVVSESLYQLSGGYHYQDVALKAWLDGKPLPGGVPVLLRRDALAWCRETRFERCVTWMDSVGFPAAMWAFGVYYLPKVYGVFTETANAYGGSSCPPERLKAGRDGTWEWLNDPQVCAVVDGGVRAALLRAVK